MAFRNNYANLVAEQSQAHTRLIRDYDGSNRNFDVIVIGSGMGGGILADDLADRRGQNVRILVVDAGSFIYPTHVFNVCSAPNDTLARHFGVDNFRQPAGGGHKIGEKPQLAFGGRSIFWSGLIPTAQDWELEFFPDSVRQDLRNTYLGEAGRKMNESVSLGGKAREIVQHFRNTSLAGDFEIHETPRALHQPYLNPDGTPRDRFFVEPTGVFNTAELLINQAGLTSDETLDRNGLFIKLNSFVESVDEVPFDWYEVKTTSTITGQQVSYYTPRVVIAAGSIESPKLINRSAIFGRLPGQVRQLVGFGLTDHPVTAESQAYVTSLGAAPRVDLSRADHAKIIFYSRGGRDGAGHVKFPFNIEMNINHEWWHKRDNDPTALATPDDPTRSRIDIKFSFANCLDDYNGIFSHANDGYTPDIRFKEFANLSDLLQSRFPAVAGWMRDEAQFFQLLNQTRDRVFAEFNGLDVQTAPYGQSRWPFGWGTVHHACGTLRMPWKANRSAAFDHRSVVDENLKVRGTAGMYVCDMSVMPISTAANPVRTLAGLALRLSRHLG